MRKVTVAQVAGVVLPTLEVEVPEWDGTVLLRSVTRAQIRDCRERSRLDDGKLDLEAYDMIFLAWSFADPDLTAEVGVEEAVTLLRGQPYELVYRLVRAAMKVSGTGRDAPFRGGTADDDRRRDVPGASDSPGPGRDDSGGDESEDVPA